MRIGLNLPWWDCGHDFGARPMPWRREGEGRRDYVAHARALRARCAGLGVRTVRLWLLGGGVNYPVGADGQEESWLRPAEDALVLPLPRRLRAWLMHRAGWQNEQLRVRTPPPLSEAFLDDFRRCLRAFRVEGFRLMPVLTSFEFFEPVEWQGSLPSGGRSAWVFGEGGEDHAQIERFLDATLSLLLDVAASEGGLAAIDVVNEPDWAAVGGPAHMRLDGSGYRIIPKGVRASAMSRFLERACARIIEAGEIATVGFKHADPAWISDRLRRCLVRWGARGEYLHQVHHYPSMYEWARLQPHRSLPIQPCIVGEMATIRGRALGLHIAWWRERIRDLHRAASARTYLQRRLDIVESLGYPEALLWSVHSQDLASDWRAVRTLAERQN